MLRKIVAINNPGKFLYIYSDDAINTIYSFFIENEENKTNIEKNYLLTSNLKDIFQKKGDLEFEELLDYLCEKGWLSKFESGYKLHQITKEYFLGNHTLTFEEMKSIFSYFFK